MKRKISLLVIFLLSVSSIYAFEIGDVSVDLKRNELVISSSKGEILNYEFDESLLSYAFIVETPYFKMSGYDGVVEKEYSKGLKLFPKSDLSREDFVLFPFLSSEHDTIGVLTGYAGASGRSSQRIFFINTQTGVFIAVGMTDMQGMDWITQSDHILGYKLYDTNVSFGSHATSWGHKPRTSDVFYFDDNGKAVSDGEALKGVFKAEYEKIAFSDDEKRLLQDNIMSEMKYRSIGEKLVDFVYYGFKLGKQDEVFVFLNTLHPVYVEEAKYHIE